MGTRRSYVEILHDEGYGDDLVWHINLALRGKDMRAEAAYPKLPTANDIQTVDELKQEIRNLKSLMKALVLSAPGRRLVAGDVEMALANHEKYTVLRITPDPYNRYTTVEVARNVFEK